jgi:hypothetical protein
MGCVVLVYQVVLHWFGRERLDGLITAAQILVAVVAVLGGQLPQLIGRWHGAPVLRFDAWWVAMLPSAWFAGIDDALAGGGNRGSWLLAAVGLGATAAVLGIAYGRLAGDYGSALQTLNEARPAAKGAGTRRRWMGAAVNAAPLRWWLREPVSRAAFLLSAAYLFRDRDVKVRVYPGLVPILVMPIIFLLPGRGAGPGGMQEFGIALCGEYVGMVPMMALNLLKYSQQWQASDVFRIAPMAGPAALCDGARRAVLLFLALPFALLMGLIVWAMCRDSADLVLMVPGIIAVPAYAMIPCLGGQAVPLSVATEEAKASGRGLVYMAIMLLSVVLAGLAVGARIIGWLGWFIAAEALVVGVFYLGGRAALAGVRWESAE